MSKGWNPIVEPLHDMPAHLSRWVQHYAKGSWYFATAIYETTGHIEWGKCGQWLALSAMFLSVLAAGLEAKVGSARALMTAALASLNPVVTCQLYSFYVDGLMIAYLTCFIAAGISWMLRPGKVTAGIGILAAILCINVKFTGLVYLCFIMAGFGLYSLLFKRRLLIKYVLLQIAPLLAGILIFGFNPYITNTVHRGHPLYPILGTTEYPGTMQNGNDPIEQWETPENMMGKPRGVRFGYALFGRPVFHQQDAARLMIPFTATFKDMSLYYFHEQRIAGFGPYYSGALILSMLLLIKILIGPDMPRGTVLLCLLTLIASLSVSTHAWWARYGPQMWLIPIVPIIAVFWKSQNRWLVRFNWAIAALLLLNALVVAVVHANWEIKSTRTLKEQMAQLSSKGTYEFDFEWFGEPFSERLKTADVSFETLPRRSLRNTDAKEMLSVCPGYPGTIHYRPTENETPARER